MDAAGLGQPDSEVWFGFGALYEQYGVAEAAVEAFRKVKKPEGKDLSGRYLRAGAGALEGVEGLAVRGEMVICRDHFGR